MHKKAIIIVFVIILIFFGGILRLYGNSNNPPGLNIDEVAIGYNAYSILKTARDENGVFLPLAFESYGDFKNPIPIYLLVSVISIFGLNDFSVRLLTALIGTLTIPLYFLFLKSLTKETKIAIVGTLLLSISAWHIYYSRIFYEHTIATFFVILGIWFLLRVLDGKKWSAFFSAFFLAISLYTYFAERLFVPMLVLIILVINYKKIRQNIQSLLIFFSTSIIISLPLIYASLLGRASSRAVAIFVSKDVDFLRYVKLENINSLMDLFLLFFYWLQRYLNYFQPDFLFFNGLSMTKPNTLGLGLLYLFELPMFVLGLVELFRKKVPYKYIIISWILLGILPASLTNDQRNAGRLVMIIPPLLLIITLGFNKLLDYFNALKNIIFKFGIGLLFLVIVLIELSQAYLVFNVHFPKAKGEAFMEGSKQSVNYALSVKDEYNEIVFDPVRGVEGPYIVNVPHMYILFYSQYDPQTYQTLSKRVGTNESLYGFDKYTIRKIDWIKDKNTKNTLFIGSPWSIPTQHLKEGELIKTIYLNSGYPALLLVSPK